MAVYLLVTVVKHSFNSTKSFVWIIYAKYEFQCHRPNRILWFQYLFRGFVGLGAIAIIEIGSL